MEGSKTGYAPAPLPSDLSKGILTLGPLARTLLLQGFNFFCRNSGNDSIFFNVPRHQRASAYDGPALYGHSRQKGRIRSDPDKIFDHDPSAPGFIKGPVIFKIAFQFVGGSDKTALESNVASIAYEDPVGTVEINLIIDKTFISDTKLAVILNKNPSPEFGTRTDPKAQSSEDKTTYRPKNLIIRP